MWHVWIRCDLSPTLFYLTVTHENTYLGGNRDESWIQQRERKRECMSENMKLNRSTLYLVLFSLYLIINSNVAVDKTRQHMKDVFQFVLELL